MTSPSAPIPALLTSEQVGQQLDLTPVSIDGLVRSGELSPVLVSSGGERRFWPDEVMAYALHAAISAEGAAPTAAVATGPGSVSAAPLPSPGEITRALARHGRKDRHPAWPPFTGPTERRVPAYIAFADRDHLVRYLRHRAEDEPA
jgi:hypothetical protein